MLSRLQFGFTAMFHILWPTVIVGLSVFLVIFEAVWVKTGGARLLPAYTFLEPAVPSFHRHRDRHRHTDGVPVRHELEPLL